MIHSCIKCAAKYEDTEVDAYLCADCLSAKQAIAKEIDRKFNTTEAANKTLSPLQAFEAEAKTLTRPDGTTISFAKAKL